MKRCRTREILLGVLIVLAASLATVRSVAEGAKIFTLTDPKGDDHGDGTLMYPLRTDMQSGDLDLVTFSAEAQSGGTVFEATFARAIRSPSRQTIDQIGTTLDKIAKLGFYALNIDVYVDTDRIPGSGSTVTLPGRRAVIASANAWEKAVCLTPRPYEAREALKRIYERRAKQELKKREGRISSSDAESIESAVAQDVASSVYFPTLVWVTGHKIRFFVPASFLGDLARDAWSYVVAVSGAKIEERLDVPTMLGSDKPAPESLMIIPVGPGKDPDRFGSPHEDDDLQLPIVDIIVPAGTTQEGVLKDYSPAQDRPAQLPGVVPADVKGR